MSVVLIFNQKPSEEWQLKLSELLPDTKVEVYPNVENVDKVDFVATWKPHVGYVNEFPNLKVVQSVGAGIDHLLHTDIPDHIKVTRIVDPALKQDMFEHVLACIMASMKNLLKYQQYQIENKWKPLSYKSITDTTVAILGLGEIGMLVADKLIALGFKVKGWSNSKKIKEGLESFAGNNELDDAISNTDFIINILPLTEHTKGILNTELFNKCTPNTVLINVGRGDHLVEEDLEKAIANGQIAEAYLDVFSTEPLPENHSFWSNKNIFVTPHIASITNANTALQQVADNYVNMQNNVALLNEVSLKRGY